MNALNISRKINCVYTFKSSKQKRFPKRRIFGTYWNDGPRNLNRNVFCDITVTKTRSRTFKSFPES